MPDARRTECPSVGPVDAMRAVSEAEGWADTSPVRYGFLNQTLVGVVYGVAMADFHDGSMVRAKRFGWDGSLIDAPDGPFPPSDRADEFADVEGFDPDTDVIDIEPVEGVLHFWDYANGTKTMYVVVTDTGRQFSVDPDTIEAL